MIYFQTTMVIERPNDEAKFFYEKEILEANWPEYFKYENLLQSMNICSINNEIVGNTMTRTITYENDVIGVLAPSIVIYLRNIFTNGFLGIRNNYFNLHNHKITISNSGYIISDADMTDEQKAVIKDTANEFNLNYSSL